MLAPGAAAEVALSGNIPVFRLESGTAHYRLKTLASVKLEERKSTVSPKDLVGDLVIGSDKLPAGWWTTGHTLAVVGGAAGATALGIGLAKPKPPSCKNQQGNNHCQ